MGIAHGGAGAGGEGMRLYDSIRATLGNPDGRARDEAIDEACSEPSPEELLRGIWCLDITVPGGRDGGASLFYPTKSEVEEVMKTLDVPHQDQSGTIILKDGYDRETFMVRPKDILCAKIILLEIRTKGAKE